MSAPRPLTSRSAPAACRQPRTAPRSRRSASSSPPKEIAALAAYVASLGPGPAIPDKEALDYADANAAQGGAIYRTNCSMCHNFAGSGGALTHGKFAASLKGVTAKHMYEAMLTGPQSMPVFGDGTMTPQDKREIIAYLKTIDAQSNPGGAALGKVGPGDRGRRGLDRRHRRPDRRSGMAGGEGAMSDLQDTGPAGERIHAGDPAEGTDVATQASHDSTHSGELETRFRDPGLPAHVYRHSDIDPKAAKRREREVATLFGLSTLGTLLFIVAFFAVKPNDASGADLLDRVGLSTRLLGLGLGLALFFIGAGAIHWAKTLMPDDEIVTERKPMRSADEDRRGRVEALKEGAAGAGLGPSQADPQQPARRARPARPARHHPAARPRAAARRDSSTYTAWRAGKRLVYRPRRTADQGRRTWRSAASSTSCPRASTNMPEPAERAGQGDHHRDPAGAGRAVNRRPDRKGWAVDGIVAYSKVCTHVGCPVGLYEQQTHHLLCPCHQSTFDVTKDCAVIFGPAARPLPQLPLAVDSEGYLVSQRRTSRSRSAPASGSEGRR